MNYITVFIVRLVANKVITGLGSSTNLINHHEPNVGYGSRAC